MNRSFHRSSFSRIPLLAIAFAFVSLAGAAQAADMKIGVVDVTAVTRRSSTIQSTVSKAESQVQDRQKEVETKMDDLQSKRADLAKQRSVLGADQVTKQENDIEKLREDIDDMQHDINKKLQRIQVDIMDPEVARIMAAVKTVAKREGYTIVLRAESAMYFSDSVDITALVIRELDKPASGN